MEPTDSELVGRAVAGDDRAFDKLVSRYRSGVYYVALSKVGNSDIARDLAQETFVQAYLSLFDLREHGKFGSWLAAITSNISASYLRRPRELVLPLDQILDMGCGDSLIAPAGDDTTCEILQTLPDGARTAAILYFVEQMKMTRSRPRPHPSRRYARSGPRYPPRGAEQVHSGRALAPSRKIRLLTAPSEHASKTIKHGFLQQDGSNAPPKQPGERGRIGESKK